MKNVTAITAAYRQSAIRLGMYPDILYLDRNRFEKAEIFTKGLDFTGIVEDLVFPLGTYLFSSLPDGVCCDSYKVAGPLFSSMREHLECLVPSYCGPADHLTSARENRGEGFLQRWQEKRDDGHVPTVCEASQMINVFFEWYGQQPCEGLEGRTPLSVLEAGRGPGIDEAMVRHDFLWERRLRVRRCRIRLLGEDYEADCLHGISRDTRINVLYDLSDPDIVYCHDLEWRFLGTASRVRSSHPLAELSNHMADKTLMGPCDPGNEG